ncbi:MAG: hypothetical protein QXW97_01970 [Candidatus Pacearchaeota archaeon]
MVKTKKIEKPIWLKYTSDEVRAIILKLANKGMTAEKIGLTLRDQYGIPNVKLYGFRIKEVLGDKYQDPNIINLKKKVLAIESHNKKHKKDKKAERAYIISKAKLKKREEYLNK